MKVFVTGATGWVGSAVVKELVASGHDVTGLFRSPEKKAGLTAAGARAVAGTLDDLDLLKRLASEADAVMHLAFNHDFSKFAENSEQDRLAILAIGDALVGTAKRLLVTSGTALVSPGKLATEDMVAANPAHPRRSEAAAQGLAARGVQVTSIRLPPTVHGLGDYGFVPILIKHAREKGVSAYVGDGSNRWPAVHRSDAAKLYRLVLEAKTMRPAYHPVAEEGVAFKRIAEVIGRRLGLPTESRPKEHFGWFGAFAGGDFPTASELTKTELHWTPTGPKLIEDLDQPGYFAA